ncbi:Stringent starvation protein B [Gammaproteobacteria bacterium]
MTSTRPYLIRALHEWITDNGLTPYIVVDAQAQGTEVPVQYVKEGRIVLNLNPSAVQALVMGNEWISFRARFSGRAMEVQLPIRSILAIYAKENGQGMSFSSESAEEETPPPVSPPPPPPPPQIRPGRPNLKVVK